MGRRVVIFLARCLFCWNASSCRGLHSNWFWESRSESGGLALARCGRNCAWYLTTSTKVCTSFFNLGVCQSWISCIFSESACIPWSAITCRNRGSLSAKKLHLEIDTRILLSCNLLQTWRISRIWFSKVSEKMVISSWYAQTVFPMSPSRTFSITRIAVHGALVSPCSITFHAKVPNGLFIVLSFSSSGLTLISNTSWTNRWWIGNWLWQQSWESWIDWGWCYRSWLWYGFWELSLVRDWFRHWVWALGTYWQGYWLRIDR